MCKFKVGDTVKRVRGGKSGKVFEGDTFTVVRVDYGYVMDGNGSRHHQDNLELASKSLDNLQVGDVLVHRHGHENTVLAVVNKLVAVSARDNPEEHFEWFTSAEIRESGWKLKDSENSEEITEITLEEVAELKGIPVEKLRIKEKE